MGKSFIQVLFIIIIISGLVWLEKKWNFALAGVLSWLEPRLIYQKVVDFIPGEGTYPGCRLDLQSGHIQETTNECFSLTLIFSLFFYLKAIKTNKKVHI